MTANKIGSTIAIYFFAQTSPVSESAKNAFIVKSDPNSICTVFLEKHMNNGTSAYVILTLPVVFDCLRCIGLAQLIKWSRRFIKLISRKITH